MINNFELIKSLLSFESEDIYYHLLFRFLGEVKTIQNFLLLIGASNLILYVVLRVLTIEDEVKKLCEFFQARAYINLSPKSIKRTAALQMKYLAQRMYEGDYKKIWKAWNTCAGEIKGEKPRWVVDVDGDINENELRKFIDELMPKTFNERTICKIPTKNGYHLITTSFNLQQFKEKYPDIDVHKNNPTILYIP